ncbi:hypothetical protein ACI2VH_16485 [Ralstonia nicotianae]|nr:hypothetical protein [Ralstonia pseudosolanacearum]MBX9431968.1 hypothetical protein [Ralstonia pseudosolanacearum]
MTNCQSMRDVRKCGDKENRLVGNGYSSDIAARLAAFDAITELLQADAQIIGEAA